MMEASGDHGHHVCRPDQHQPPIANTGPNTCSYITPGTASPDTAAAAQGSRRCPSVSAHAILHASNRGACAVDSSRGAARRANTWQARRIGIRSDRQVECASGTPGVDFAPMERSITIFRSYDEAETADRAEMSAMTPQERLDRALALHAHYREAFGDAGQGLVRVARVVQREGR